MGKLAKIQATLKAPKGQHNSFGKYDYRSCEDILEAVKPLLDGATLTLSDEIVEVNGRVYVKATATFIDGDSSYSTTAYAREQEERKGMDAAQITGAASSYARKYCLNGLFLIDDTKDADTRDKPASAKEQEGTKKSNDKSEHYCKLHGTAFFKRGKMPSHAHPIEGTEPTQWCYEHTAKKKEAATKPAPAATRATPGDSTATPDSTEGLFKDDELATKDKTPVTAEQIAQIKGLLLSSGKKLPALGSYCNKTLKWEIKDLKDLQKWQFDQLCEDFENNRI